MVGLIGRKTPEILSLRRLAPRRYADDKLSAVFLPVRGKGPLVQELLSFFHDLDLDKLRIVRPSKFAFLCGGFVRSDNVTKADSLRDYLLRVRRIERKLTGQIVLAEAANQLYRETEYGDLISFEEDIARIAAIVLVIAESPGSLAELGAFASSPTIRPALRIMLQDEYSHKESFIRWGPVERIRKDNTEHVAFYPWRINKQKKIITSSVKPHYNEIVTYINTRFDEAPQTELFLADKEKAEFFIILWIVYVSKAISLGNLYDLAKEVMPGITNKTIKNKIFSMRTAGWISSIEYSGKTYFFVRYDIDPFAYSFKAGVSNNDSVRRKLAVAQALLDFDKTPKHVRTVATERRAVTP